MEIRIGNVVIALSILAAALPFVNGPYIFALDFVTGPSRGVFKVIFFGFGTSTFGGTLPIEILTRVITTIFDASFAYHLRISLLLVCLAIVAHYFVDIDGPTATYTALLVVFSPYVYSRLLVGQYLVIWGFLGLLFATRVYLNVFHDGIRKHLSSIIIAGVFLGINPHTFYMSVIVLGFISLFSLTKWPSFLQIRRILALIVLTIVVNGYWIAPVLIGSTNTLSPVSSTEVVSFAPNADTGTILFSISTMHGFWRGGYLYAKDIFPVTQILYVPILFFAIYGFVTHHQDHKRGYAVKAIAATAIVALLLGAGVQGPGAPIFRWAFEHFPFFAGMRDSQKFVAILVLAYGYLGALGFGTLLERVNTFNLGTVTRPEFNLGDYHLPSMQYDRGQVLATSIVVLAVLTPIAYTFPMVTGYADQVNSQDYPPEWYEVQDYLEGQPDNGGILFLPWHQYMDYHWLEGRQKRIATPARVFFSRPVVQGDNVEIGPTYSTSTNPVSNYVEFLFGLGPRYNEKSITNLGELLSHVDIKYILVTKEADWRDYNHFLVNQSDLSLVMENDLFRVYKNEHRVNRVYATDRLIYVEDLDAFLNRSKTEDTTEALYVINDDRAGEVINHTSRERNSVNATSAHPAKYQLEGTKQQYSVFIQRQATFAKRWRYNGKKPMARHLGISPIFPSDPDGATVSYRTFYRIYLPSYIISISLVLGLIGLVLLDRWGRLDPIIGTLDGIERWLRGFFE